MPDVDNSPRGKLLDDGRNELVEIIDTLENCLEKAEALELGLLGALIDHAIGEAKSHLVQS